MATYLKYFIFFERLRTEHKTMTESTRPRGCHFIIQKTDILATTGMKATFNFTLKKSENKYAALTIWRTNPPLTWGPGKLNTAIDLIYIFQLLVISNTREWFYNQSLKSIVTMMQQLYCVLRLLYKMIWSFEFTNKIPKCDHATESYCMSSALLWCSSLRCTRCF